MKKVYDYNTKKLTESYQLDKSLSRNPKSRKVSRLNESALDDVLDGRELCNPAELASAINVAYKNVLRSNAAECAVVSFWSHRGNSVMEDIEEACDSLGLSEYTQFVSARNIDYYEGENARILVIDEYTLLDPTDAITWISENGINDMVICICSLDSRNAEAHADELANVGAVSYLYTPRVEHITRGVDPEYDDEAYESVTEKFAKYRKLYEGSDEENASDDPFADMFADGGSDEKSGEGSSEDGDGKGDEGEEGDKEGGDEEGGDDDEYVPMTAIIITVAKDDADKCKDEMIDAGISEDGIEILDGEDDDENAKIRVDADYAKELKDYLSGKGIDLEEKIGGEIVDDTEGDEGEEGEGEEDSDKKEDKDKEGEGEPEDDFDFGDLFGDDEASADEGK